MAGVQLVVQNISGVVVVNFGGTSLLDASAIEAVGRQLYELVDDQARRKILLDFSSVRFLSSSMLGVLVRLHKKAVAIGGRLALLGLQPKLLKVFKITRLDKVFDIYDDEGEAFRSFGV